MSLSTPQSHRVPEVPSESTATALLPHRPRSMPRTCIPRHAAHSDQPDRSDPPRPHAQQEGGTHRTESLVSAESELGKLPFSLLLLRCLHTRSGLGRSAVLRRTHGSDVPLRYPRSVPTQRVPLEYSSVTSRATVPSESTAMALLPHRPRSMPPTCQPPTCRALGAEPTDPTLLGRTRSKKGARTGIQA